LVVDSAALISAFCWFWRCATLFHWKLRAREDGEKPSPPRDCKAGNFGRGHCFVGWLSIRESWLRGGKAAPQMLPPSQETDGVSILMAIAEFIPRFASGQPSTPAREGEEEIDEKPLVLAGCIGFGVFVYSWETCSRSIE
jgi:hypothetical protein